MKHIKTFSIFESTQGLTPEQEEFLNECTRGTWRVNPEGLVDIEGTFSCFSKGLKDLRGIKFGRVTGDFSCSHNSLETLEGAPREVGVNFFCSNNSLETLEGAPREVRGHFGCSYNSLKTLEGAPREVGGRFRCHNNPLQSLEGAPEIIGGKFWSDLLDVPEGQWSISTLVTMFLESSGEERNLLGTLVSPEALQRRIDKNPERAAVEMKSLAGLPEYKSLKWPTGLQSEVDLLSDLDRIGL